MGTSLSFYELKEIDCNRFYLAKERKAPTLNRQETDQFWLTCNIDAI